MVAKVQKFYRQQRGASGYSDEWYTPSVYLEAARTAMGSIDLDPASCFAAQRRVRAARFFCAFENGLGQPWKGNVWLNPPYSRLVAWCGAARKRYEAGQIKQVCLLINANTSTDLNQGLADFPQCTIRKRVVFHNERGKTDKNVYGSTVFYMGPNVERFAYAFCTLGRILIPYSFHS